MRIICMITFVAAIFSNMIFEIISFEKQSSKKYSRRSYYGVLSAYSTY